MLASPDDRAGDDGRDALVRLVRDEGSRVLATLVRTTGSLDVAEDAVQDAVVKALELWPVKGVPPEPRAWLTLVARNKAFDLLRRESRRADKETATEFLMTEADAPLPDPEVVADDLLRLIFTCCHPALEVETQTALALRTLCGLTTTEVARALLVPEATMAKRLTRARQKIAVARIPYRTPEPDELPSRLSGVLATVYLLFNEGYHASAGDDLIRSQLTGEAIRLGRLLHQLLPEEASTTGLLALLLLQSSRQAARLDDEGGVVLLLDQDRSKWNQDVDQGRHDAARDGAASHPDPTGPLRHPGGDRCLPRPGQDLGGHQLGSDSQLVRRAADRPRHPRGPAQSRRGGGGDGWTRSGT